MNAAADRTDNIRELVAAESTHEGERRALALTFTAEQRATLKATLCRDLTDPELSLFLEACKRYGLDPFLRQIHAVVRGRGDNRKMTIQAGIDGLRLIADRTRLYRGRLPIEWCGADGKWTTAWIKDGQPVAARVGVRRAGWDEVVWGIARYTSYVQTYDGKPSQTWGKMPDTMLAKCAEAQALRAAFPADLAGIYADEEMMQADSVNSADGRVDIDPETMVDAAPNTTPHAAPTDGEHDRLPTAPELRARLLATGDERKLQLMWARWWNETNGEVGRLLARVEHREAEYRGWVSRMRNRAYDAGIVRDEEGWADLVVSIVERNDVTAHPLSYAEWKRVEIEVETVAEQISAERRTETADEHQLDELPIDGMEGRS